MLGYIIQRSLQGIVVLLGLSLLVFAGVYAIGNPVYILIDPRASPEQIEATIRSLGLDQPLWRQYLIFLSNAIQGELGQSFLTNRPALTVILERLPATLELAFMAMLVAIVIGFPLGLIAGMRAGSPVDQFIMTVSILGFSMPSFWLGMLLIMVLAIELQILPTIGRGETIEILGVPVSILTWDGLQHIVMPALNLAVFQASLIIRLARSAVREHLQLDYVKYARARGLSPRRIMSVHILKNILIPIVTVMGVQFGMLIAFTVVTETVFAWPGIGKLIIDSIANLDRPVIVAYVLVTATLFIVINLCVDLAYAILDPRIRLTSQP
jgi:peptide/nickel transport system permease protein